MTMAELELKRKLELAKSRKTDPAILLALSKDEDERVRYCVAWNFSCPLEAIINLASEYNWQIREAIAKHYNAPRWILEDLARDPHYAVRLQVAKNPYATGKIMGRLAHDPEWIVRREVAINAKARDVFSLRLLANDECDFVRTEVARNLHTPKEEREKLKAEGMTLSMICF